MERSENMKAFPWRKLVLAVGAILLLSALFAALPADSGRLAELEARRIHKRLAADVPEGNRYRCTYVIQGESLLSVAEELEAAGAFGAGKKEQSNCTVTLSRAGSLYRAERQVGAESSRVVESPALAWTALLPALLAVVLAVATRRLLPCLFLGVAAGAVLLARDGGLSGPFLGLFAGTFDVLYSVLTDRFHFWIFLFTFSLVGMVNVTIASGGMAGLAGWLGRLARNARSTQVATALLGLAIFFDDYSNTVVVGGSMRPLSDRARVSREKLAYIVDSTAAPIAGLALISTWIGYEVGLLGDALNSLGLDTSPYSVFLSTLPFRFYCLLTLGFVLLNIVSGREYGPMRTAEQRARITGEVVRPGSVPLSGAAQPKALGKPMALNALLPVATVIFLTFAGMAANGAGLVRPWSLHPEAIPVFETSRLFALEDNYLIASEDGTWVLALASIVGSLLAVLLGRIRGKAALGSLLLAWLSAGRVLLLAFGVLILAWAIGDVNSRLGTGAYLVASLADNLAPWLLPGLIFLLGALISFSTGSSWGTMAVLLPAALPLAYHVGGFPLLVISAGAVLDGSIFGDHCSPLSDTTIMSSIAAGCDHMDHVRTQFPYSVTVALAAVLLGYLNTEWLSPLVSYALSLVFFYAILRLAGRRIKPGEKPNLSAGAGNDPQAEPQPTE